MITPYVVLTILCLAIAAAVMLFATTRQPPIKIDDGKHKGMFVSVVVLVLAALLSAFVHVWIATR